MPSTSKKQHNFMAAIANSPAFAKKVGIKQSVGKDFVTADKGKKFAKGGMSVINKQNTRHGMMDMPVSNLSRYAGFKRGGAMKKNCYEDGGDVEYSPHEIDSESRFAHGLTEEEPKKAKSSKKRNKMQIIALNQAEVDKADRLAAEQSGAFYGGAKSGRRTVSQVTKPKVSSSYDSGGSGIPMKKGGMMKSLFKGKETYGEELKEANAIKSGKISPKQYASGEKSEKKLAKGGGIESRGKTKGTMVKMARGGGIESRGKTRGKMC